MHRFGLYSFTGIVQNIEEGKIVGSSSRWLRDYNLNHKHKADRVNWKWGKTVISQSPPVRAS